MGAHAQSLLNRIFRREVSAEAGCPPWMIRWTLLSTPWGSIFLHKFLGPDWSKDFHDHPARFISIGLRGSYRERVPVPGTQQAWTTRFYRAPWIRTFPANFAHSIDAVDAPCWTLILSGRRVRETGFWMTGRWVPWQEYVDRHGVDRRNC